MTEYPLSTLPQNRDCTYYIFRNKKVCSRYPCLHTPCHDPDWLADHEDYLRDEKVWVNVRRSFRSPELYRQTLSDEEWAQYEVKFEQLRRLHEKESEITAALEAHRKWFKEQRCLHWERSFQNLSENAKIFLKKKWELEGEIGAEMVKELRRQKMEEMEDENADHRVGLHNKETCNKASNA
jgi:hypothetical protein